MSWQNIPLKDRTDFRDPAELRPQRLFAFELRRVDARLEPSGGISAGCLRWQELPRFSAGQSSNTIAHFALDFSRKERVCGGHGQRASLACSSPPPAPRGLRGVWLLPEADRPVSDTKTLSARTTEFRQGLAEVLRTPPIFVAAGIEAVMYLGFGRKENPRGGDVLVKVRHR